MRKYPIGIQDFEKLRKGNFLYVDKTALIHRLITEGAVYFLSRPRRFGKSLLISTLEALFEGKRELFDGLAIDSMEWDWTPYPVIRIDMNAKEYTQGRSYLETHLHERINENVTRLNLKTPDNSLPPDERLKALINQAYSQWGEDVVVLIDEYDKPLLETMFEPELHSEMKKVLKSFYGVLKSSDKYLKFVLLTGVTKFGQVSVFSDLNQLEDISMVEEYATICGITQDEIELTFENEINEIAKKESASVESTLNKIRKWYNGYHFCEDSLGVYNPFSSLHLFKYKKFRNYWFQTGTPTFLMDLLEQSDYDLRNIDSVKSPASGFADYRADADRPIPVLYQAGYLTIADYNERTWLYTLTYPNAEVRYSFIEYLIDRFTKVKLGDAGFHISMFSVELEEGKVEEFMERLKVFYSSIPYDLTEQKERYYQTIFYLVFTMLGQFVESEVRSSKGRCDAVVKTDDMIYVFEFKLFDSAESAMEQIETQGYANPFMASGKRVISIGVEFDKEERNIGRWIVKEN